MFVTSALEDLCVCVHQSPSVLKLLTGFLVSLTPRLGSDCHVLSCRRHFVEVI